MSIAYSGAPHVKGAAPTTTEAPNAALLIDFDNVTMGMRSDLSKELKHLLNSDIIKGKVTVQRAYADWRRYPQYIVPLSENSVDLIFAPAYGSSKKNATDIRMAIDGMELVFIRPEIGTFILLTGDSDFSSLVLKLKEYGKYVIGVGIQESSSDILVQNCDEYYSYTSIAGLKKTTDSANKPVDPWILVEKAVDKMASRDDVMRSDRLKQVMIEIDPSFDESNYGFSKFSRFLSEASGRGLVRTRKMENGQYEVLPSDGGKGGGGKDRQSSSRRGSDRESSDDRGRRDRSTSRKSGSDKQQQDRSDKGSRGEESPSSAPKGDDDGGDPLQKAYGLLRGALDSLSGGGGAPVRDSDLKRKMLEMDSSFDEGELGFGKFSRFLRQAHDHEVVDLEKRGEGTYQVSPRGSGEKQTKEVAAKPDEGQKKEQVSGGAGPSGLFTRRSGGSGKRGDEGPPPLLEGQVVALDGGGKAPSEAEDPKVPASGSPQDLDPATLGLPTDETALIRYLTNSYKGVGKKTAETLVGRFGVGLYQVLQEDPDKIGSVIPANRAQGLLDGWKIDIARRLERRAAEKSQPAPGKKPEENQGREDTGKDRPSGSRRRTRRGSRTRGRGGSGKSGGNS